MFRAPNGPARRACPERPVALATGAGPVGLSREKRLAYPDVQRLGQGTMLDSTSARPRRLRMWPRVARCRLLRGPVGLSQGANVEDRRKSKCARCWVNSLLAEWPRMPGACQDSTEDAGRIPGPYGCARRRPSRPRGSEPGRAAQRAFLPVAAASGFRISGFQVQDVLLVGRTATIHAQ